MLLQAGADPNFNSRGQSAFACFEHCTEDEAMACARLLIAAGGDPSAKNCENDTPLHTAIMRNQVSGSSTTSSTCAAAHRDHA